MKSDLSLGGLKKQKKGNSFIKIKKSAQIEIDFFIVNFPMSPELVFLSPLVYWEHKIGSFLVVKFNFDKLF